MLKKEFSDVLKQTFYFVLVVLFLPGFLLLTTIVKNLSYFHVLFPIFQFGLLFWAMFMGASLFSFDQGQRGMEYLLSLPYSRLQLLGLKILPRLVAIVLFYLLHLILFNAGGRDFMIMPSLFFTLIYFSLFIISLSFSAVSDNFIILSALSVFSLFIYLGLLYFVYWLALTIRDIPFKEFGYYFSELFTIDEDPLNGFGLIIVIALLFPFLISFILSFRKFDVRPAKTYNKRYFKYFAPIFILCFVISALFAYQGTSLEESKDFYLTQNLKLIETSYFSKIKIHEKDKVSEIQYPFYYFWPFLEENENVYDMSLFGGVARINTNDYRVEIIYEAQPKRTIGWFAQRYNQTFVVLEKGNNNRQLQLVLIDETTKKITRIPFEHELLRDYRHPFIIGTDKIGNKRFWLICSERPLKYPILRLWEGGRVEGIGRTQKFPLYVNQMLITYTDKAMIISKLGENGSKTMREIPEGKDLGFRAWPLRINLNPAPLKELYARDGQKYHRLDLETLEIEDLGDWKGYTESFYPDDCYFVERDFANKLVKLYLLKQGKLEPLKSFPGIDLRVGLNSFRLFKAGVIAKKGKKIRVYAFPDLRELKFKNL